MTFEAAFFALGLAVAGGLALLARRNVGADASPAVRGLALAADSISAPFFLGLAGAVFTWGYDGLAFVLGLGAGYLLLQLLVAPLLPLSGATSVPDYFGRRYGSTARVLACLAVVLSMATLLIAELMAAALVGARLLQLSYAVCVAIAATALLACFALKGRATILASSLLFVTMLAAFLAPLVQVSTSRYGVPVPQIAYANTVWEIQSLEETLLEQNLADPAVLKPLLRPFLSLSPLNFLGLVLALALGLASLPSLLARHFTSPGVHAARWSSVFALLFAALLITAAPALAAYAKLSLLSLIGDRLAFGDLPAWIFTYGNLGLVEICGQAATDAVAVAKACTELSDPTTVLRLQDLTIDSDMITLAAPEIAGLGVPWLGVLAAAALAATLMTAGGPLGSIVEALGGGSGAAGSTRWEPLTMAAAAVAVAAVGAVARPADMLTMATWALTLAAAGLFPALIGGLWWHRATAVGAAAAIAVGLTVALLYITATRFFAVPLFDAFSSLSNAGPMASETFAELKQAWSAAAPGPAKDAAWLALDQHAQGIANLWGIKNLAVVVLAVPVGIVALIVVSLLTPHRETA